MKKLTLTILTAMGMLLFMTANSNAGVHFGVYVGGPGYYYGPGPNYGDGYYNGYGHYRGYRHTRYRRH
jgi:hypothetical protein